MYFQLNYTDKKKSLKSVLLKNVLFIAVRIAVI